jgi:1,4-alpha-glucan branching enzyme
VTAADTFRLSDHDIYLFGEGAGRWEETLNSNALHYGGDGSGNFGGVDAAPARAHGKFQSLTLTLPPDSTLFFTSAEREASR